MIFFPNIYWFVEGRTIERKKFRKHDIVNAA